MESDPARAEIFANTHLIHSLASKYCGGDVCTFTILYFKNELVLSDEDKIIADRYFQIATDFLIQRDLLPTGDLKETMAEDSTEAEKIADEAKQLVANEMFTDLAKQTDVDIDLYIRNIVAALTK